MCSFVYVFFSLGGGPFGAYFSPLSLSINLKCKKINIISYKYDY